MEAFVASCEAEPFTKVQGKLCGEDVLSLCKNNALVSSVTLEHFLGLMCQQTPGTFASATALRFYPEFEYEGTLYICSLDVEV
jgi:hypothetical protein